MITHPRARKRARLPAGGFSPAGLPALRPLAGGRQGLALALAIVVGAVSFGTAGIARAEGDAPASRRILLEAAGPAPASVETSWEALEELLLVAPSWDTGLADGATLPDARPEAVLERVGSLSCGTALMRAAERAAPRAAPERQAAIRLLLSPPRLATELSHAIPGEPLVIRWDANSLSRHALFGRDTNGDRIPDGIPTLADEARRLLARLTELTGWERGPDAPIEIRLAATPFQDGSLITGPAASSVIVLGREHQGPERLAALAHQLAHALLAPHAAELPPSFEEALATWLGETAFASVAEVDVPAGQLLPPRHARRSLLSPGIGAARGDASFLRFTSEILGLPSSWISDALAIVPRHAEEARRMGRLAPAEIPLAATAEALDESLALQGFTLAEAVAGHQIWALEQDLAFREASLSVDQELDRLPESLRIAASDLPPFGLLRLGVQPPETGGLVVDVDCAEPLRSTLVASLADGTIRRFALDGQPITLPAGSVRRAVILVQSPGIPRHWSRWPVALVETDEVRVQARENHSWPFALTSLAAEALPDQVTLSWETSSEEDLSGWIVERAVRPSGPWLPLSEVPLPAQAWPDVAASYSFIDETPRPSQRYHYRVRALTLLGLGETSPPLSVRSLPRAR